MEECFYEDLEVNEVFSVEFEVVRGGLLDINIRLLNPKGKPVVERMAFFSKKDEEKADEGRVTYTANFGGRHKFCFDNSISRWTAKVVRFRNIRSSERDDIA